jgi:type IV pilus assembly protein PilF
MILKNGLFCLVIIAMVSCSSGELKSLSVEEKKAEVFYARGTGELINKNYSQALTYLLQAKELSPKDSKIRNNLGMAYYFREQQTLAEQELKEAINLDEKNSDARLNLGSLYLSKKMYKEARLQFEIAEQDLTFVNQFRNFYNLAILNLAEGDRKTAFTYLAKSIKEKEDYCLAHFKLGELYSEEFKYAQALESFRESGKGTCVSEPAPHYQQAMTLLNLNKTTEAKRKFTEITEKFSGTRFGTLASIQAKKIQDNQSSARSTQTEVIKSKELEDTTESPRF